uniref:Uncharacterized protein n=1 Tax=viral metagenome TaxID=1070528 RepID=A0A6M3LIJ6_9ZZZZ
MRTSKRKLREICDNNDVQLRKRKEQGRIVYSLHGFLANIQAVVREIEGYWIERATSGYYLYRDDLLWK